MKKLTYLLIFAAALTAVSAGSLLFSSPVGAAPARADIENACRDAGVDNRDDPISYCVLGFEKASETFCDTGWDLSLFEDGNSTPTQAYFKEQCLIGVQVARSGVLSGGTTTTTTKTTAKCADRGILGLPAWYRGVVDPANNCAIITPSGTADIGPFIWKIVLNVIEMVVVLTAYIALGFILYGGFLFITGGSNPGSIEKGRKTLLNAVIGLVMSLAAVAIVNLIFRIIP